VVKPTTTTTAQLIPCGRAKQKARNLSPLRNVGGGFCTVTDLPFPPDNNNNNWYVHFLFFSATAITLIPI
jgi:hypothetical protein